MQKQIENPGQKNPRKGMSSSFFAFAISQRRTDCDAKQAGFKDKSQYRKEEFATSFKMLFGAVLLTTGLLSFFGPQNPLSFKQLGVWGTASGPDSEKQGARTKSYAQAKGSAVEKRDEDVFLRHNRTEIEESEPLATTAGGDSDDIGNKEAVVGKEKLTAEIDRAKELVDSGKHEEAKEMLERVLEKSPENHEALAELGMLHLIDLGDRQGAFDYLKRAISADPSNAAVVEEYSALCSSLGRNDQCLELLSHLEKSSPQNAAALAQGKAQILIQEKRYSEAIPSLEAAASSANTSQAYKDLATAYREGGQSAKVIEALELAAEKERELKASGFYEGNPELADENYVLRQLELISELELQGKTEAAGAALEKIKGVVQSESKFASIVANFEKHRN